MRTFNVRYTDPQNCADETQFDIVDADFATMMTEIARLFSEFCKETYGDDQAWITAIEEVPYDGEENEHE